MLFNHVGGQLLEFGPIHAGELRPPGGGVPLEKPLVEDQLELRLDNLVLAHAVAQQRHGAGSLGDGAGARGFVVYGLAYLLLHEVPERLMEKAHQAATAARINDWLTSLGLKPPD
ncbi:hypothetical protein JQ631_28740 [Bradyrhizobium manausense]|uniref:hypothetical protein n=1 Tax=Bradyrhizobium manausense TaxID=989370 RepID=UPI001BA91977|nr:hypothetical protein [Bradyrhizobium manausense]MBR0793080.1 hypothetical protein [Bradyrhizobium manausense]